MISAIGRFLLIVLLLAPEIARRGAGSQPAGSRLVSTSSIPGQTRRTLSTLDNTFPALILAAQPAQSSDAYLFTSFRGNGEDGVYFALSRDGYRWTPLNDNKPWLKPQPAGMLMRDPCIALGPNGVYHMLWTWGWRRDESGLRIGHASSRDLIEWSPQQPIPILPGEPAARNAWAPEMYYDRRNRSWLIFWATTIPGKFGATEHEMSHRIYAMTTRDFRQFSSPRLFFDPGHSVIDSTLLEHGGKYVMIYKDERQEPVKKDLHLAFADKPEGPYTASAEAFTKSWVEGPSAVRIGGDWFVYFDHYRKPQHYEAMQSKDLVHWEDIGGKISFPPDHRHGTVIRIPEPLARQLEKTRR